MRRIPNRFRYVDTRNFIEVALRAASRNVARVREEDGLVEVHEQLWASLKALGASSTVHPVAR